MIESLAELSLEQLLIDPEHQRRVEQIARKNTRGTSVAWEDAAQAAHRRINRYYGLESPLPAAEGIPRAHLIPGPPGSHCEPRAVAFHQRERNWSETLARRDRPDLWAIIKAQLRVEDAAVIERYFLNEVPDS
ncbi:MAG: hypothetical protein ACFB8W_10145 [Elainellaceae cyanobacterium]